MLTPAQKPRGLARMIFTYSDPSPTERRVGVSLRETAETTFRAYPTRGRARRQATPKMSIATRRRVAMQRIRRAWQLRSFLELERFDRDDHLVAVLGNGAGD